MMNKIIISAGGTGGHIIPALNVAKELINRGVEVHYIGNKNSMEEDIITKNNIPFYDIDVQKLYRSFTLKHIFFPFKLIKSIIKCRKYFKIIKPDAFVGFGGYVSGPTAIAAYTKRCPVFIQEQNLNPGITNNWIGKIAKNVFIVHEKTKKYFKKNGIVTGNPVKTEKICKTSIIEINKKFSVSFEENHKKLLVLGGSQGSVFINNLLLDNINFLIDQKIDIFWQTGKNNINAIKERIRNYNNIYAFDFTDSIGDMYANADFIISRGGALSLAEIDIYKIPAFVIPLKTAAVNEQYHNAKMQEDDNKCVLFDQTEKDNFQERFIYFIKKSSTMYSQTTESIHLDAVKKIVDFLMQEKNYEK